MEFYLNIYFTIYPIHPFNNRPSPKLFKKAKEDFKSYLDTRGNLLSKTSEFLPYYALPYVKNPADHPNFKHMFNKEWIGEVRASLKDFLSKSTERKKASTLMQMYTAFKKNQNQDQDL